MKMKLARYKAQNEDMDRNMKLPPMRECQKGELSEEISIIITGSSQSEAHF